MWQRSRFYEGCCRRDTARHGWLVDFAGRQLRQHWLAPLGAQGQDSACPTPGFPAAAYAVGSAETRRATDLHGTAWTGSCCSLPRQGHPASPTSYHLWPKHPRLPPRPGAGSALARGCLLQQWPQTKPSKVPGSVPQASRKASVARWPGTWQKHKMSQANQELCSLYTRF